MDGARFLGNLEGVVLNALGLALAGREGELGGDLELAGDFLEVFDPEVLGLADSALDHPEVDQFRGNVQFRD